MNLKRWRFVIQKNIVGHVIGGVFVWYWRAYFRGDGVASIGILRLRKSVNLNYLILRRLI